MRELIFPTTLRRLNYLLRVLPLNLMIVGAFSSLDASTEQNQIQTLCAALLLTLYAVFFVYLPRIRDCGMESWTLILAFIPYVSSFLGILLLFRPSRPLYMPTRREQEAALPTIAGSTCVACGTRLIFSGDGVISSSGEVFCNSCNATRQAPVA